LKPIWKKKKGTIPHGLKAASCTNCGAQPGPATWPKPAPFGSPCRPGCGQSACTTGQCTVTTAGRGTWRACLWLNSGGEMIYGAQPLRCYTKTHLRQPGRGSSPVEWSGRRKPDGNKEKLGVRWTEVSETELFWCKGWRET
jgi:hypothetical protein